MAGRRPRRDDRGPAQRAPTSPPRVKTEETVAKAASLMGMQSGRRPAGTLSFGFDEWTHAARRAAVEMVFLRQVMTSWGALSSAWGSWTR